MANVTLSPHSKPKEDHNPGEDEFNKIIEKNFSAGDERMMEERAQDGTIDDNAESEDQEESPGSTKARTQEGRESGTEKSGTQTGTDDDERVRLAERDSPVNHSYNPVGMAEKEKSRRWLKDKRKVAAGGGIAGLLVAIFGAFFTTGPLEFVHMARIMEELHYSVNQDQSDERVTRLARYIYHRTQGNAQNVRLNRVMNSYADRIETKMNKTGIQTRYTQQFGFREGYVIDPDKLARTDLDELKDKGPQQVKNHFQNKYPDVKMTIVDGKVFIDTSNLGYFKSRKLTYDMLRQSGYSRKASYLGARVMGKRAGVTWHPIKKIDNKILQSAEARYNAWKKERSKMITQGADSSLATKRDPRTAPDATDAEKQTANDNAGSAAGEADTNLEDARSTGEAASNGDDKAVTQFRDRLSVRTAVGGAALVGVACLAKGLDDNADNIKHAQVVLPLIRMGVEVLSLGNQVMSGEDIDMETLSYYKKQFNGNDSSVFEAESLRTELGQKGGKPADETLTTIKEGTPFHFLNEGAIGQGLGPVCSAPAQIGLTLVSFLGGPISAIAGTIAFEIANRTFMDDIAKWLSGKAIDPAVAGATYGNYINFGNRLAANSQAMASGGRELDSGEEKRVAAFQKAEADKEFRSQSLAYKLFDPYDYRSVLSRVVDQKKPSVGENVAMVASTINPGHLFSSFSRVISPKVKAEYTHSYDYKFKKIAFSIEEMNDSEIENPYKNAEEVVNSILPAHGGLIEKSKKCFGVEIDPVSYDILSYEAGDPTYADFEKEDCSSKDKNWMKVRFYIAYTQDADSIACYEGEDESCTRIGMDSGETSSVEAPTPSGDASMKETITVDTPGKFITMPARYSCPGRTTRIDSRIAASLAYILTKYNMCVADGLASGHKSHGAGVAVDVMPRDDPNGTTKDKNVWKNSVEAAARDMGWWGDSAADPKSSKGCAKYIPGGYGQCMGGNGEIPKWVRWLGYNGDVDHGDPWHVYGGNFAHLHIGWDTPNGDGTSPTIIASPRQSVYTFNAPVPDDLKDLIN